MARIIRIIEDTLRWSNIGNEFSPDKLLALTLQDVMPDKKGNLSVFLAESDAVIIRIVSAFIMKKSSIVDGSYISIEKELLDSEFKLKYKKGNTIDENVNLLHHDIEELSADETLQLAKFFKQNGTCTTIPWQEIARHAAERLDATDANKLIFSQINIKSQKFFDEILNYIQSSNIRDEIVSSNQLMNIRSELDKKIKAEQSMDKLEAITKYIDELTKFS